jgi:toxin-antitoxin system PIN domain toxin
VIALLDVNILVALFDPVHVHHELAHRWFGQERNGGWATCPLTENGFVRVLSNPTYPGRGTTPDDAIHRLSQFRQSGNHTFWPDMLSICESSIIRSSHIGSYQRLTDIYLLALAVENGGRLATFDRSIPFAAVTNADAGSLSVLG